MGKGAVVIVSALLLLACGFVSDCSALNKITRSGDTHATG
jgi:hypothetical protein